MKKDSITIYIQRICSSLLDTHSGVQSGGALGLQHLDLLLLLVLDNTLFLKVPDLQMSAHSYHFTKLPTQLLMQSLLKAASSDLHFVAAVVSLRGSRILCLSRHAKYLSRESQHTARWFFLVRSGGVASCEDEENRPMVKLDRMLVGVTKVMFGFLFYRVFATGETISSTHHQP